MHDLDADPTAEQQQPGLLLSKGGAAEPLPAGAPRAELTMPTAAAPAATETMAEELVEDTTDAASCSPPSSSSSWWAFFAAAISPPAPVAACPADSSSATLPHPYYYHHKEEEEESMIPVAPPAAAATATTPLPPPYVAVDMESPIKDHAPTPRHFGFAPPPPAAAASAAGSILVSPTKPSTAATSVAAHTPVPPCATNDLEAGQTPFRLCERVVIFTAAYHVCDGVSLTIRKLRAHLQAKGIESRVVSSGPEGWSEPDVFTVPSIPLPIVNADDNFGYSLGFRLTEACKAQIRAFDPSLVHFTVPDFLALDALRWAKAEGIPVMGTWHSNYADYLRFYNIEMMRGTVEKYIRSFYVNMPIFVPTPFIRNKLLQNGFPQARVGIWGRGVNLELFTPRNRSLAFRRAKGIADDEVVILWVGRLVKEKSPDIWAEVVRRLHRNDDGKLRFRALVVGAGSYEGQMRGLPRTECLGWLGGQALAEVYASVDVFLFPSEVETFGNVTLEALASGVPCVASAGCSGHLVQHGANGFVVHGGDVDEYYALTKRLVSDATLRSKLAAKARPSILGLEHQKVMDIMLGHYDGVIRGHNERGLGDPRQRRVGDRYLSFVHRFFSLVLVVLTPALKAYVAGIRLAQKARAGHLLPLPLPPLKLPAGWPSLEAAAAKVTEACARLTAREMRALLALCYCVGLYLLYDNWRSFLL